MLYKDENRLWEYDISRYSWIEKKPLPSTIKGKIDKYSFMINGKGYCGNLAKTDTKLEHELWEYDLTTNAWRNLEANKTRLTNNRRLWLYRQAVWLRDSPSGQQHLANLAF